MIAALCAATLATAITVGATLGKARRREVLDMFSDWGLPWLLSSCTSPLLLWTLIVGGAWTSLTFGAWTHALPLGVAALAMHPLALWALNASDLSAVWWARTPRRSVFVAAGTCEMLLTIGDVGLAFGGVQLLSVVRLVGEGLILRHIYTYSGGDGFWPWEGDRVECDLDPDAAD